MDKCYFSIAISFLLLMSNGYAAADLSKAVLPKGATVVAGDVTKNEFYILAKGQSLPTTQQAIKTNVVKVVAQNETQIHDATQSTLVKPLKLKQIIVNKPILKEKMITMTYKGERRRIITFTAEQVTATQIKLNKQSIALNNTAKLK